jgi:hypothetical protein
VVSTPRDLTFGYSLPVSTARAAARARPSERVGTEGSECVAGGDPVLLPECGQEGGSREEGSTGVQCDPGDVEEDAFEDLAQVVEGRDRDASLATAGCELGFAGGRSGSGGQVEGHRDLGGTAHQVFEDLGVGFRPVRPGTLLADLPGTAGPVAANEGELTGKACRVRGEGVLGCVEPLGLDPVLEPGDGLDLGLSTGRLLDPLLVGDGLEIGCQRLGHRVAGEVW